MPPSREGRLQEELSELRRGHICLVDDSPPQGCQASAEVLLPDVGVDDGQAMRER